MLLFGVFLNAGSLFPVVPVSALPLSSGARSAAAASNAYLSQPNLHLTSPMPKPNPPAFRSICFNSREDLNLTAVAEDCSNVFNDIILRVEGPFEQRAFSQISYMNSVGHWIPARLVFGQCTIFVGSVNSASAGMFSFLEVALMANRILSDCVTSQRRGSGGLMQIGSREHSFYVSVEGHLPDSNVNAVNKTDILAIPDSKVTKQTPDAKKGTQSPIDLHPRKLNSSVASISSSEALSRSNSSGNVKAETDHDIDCFPRGSRLPNANIDDCQFIIDSIILAMKDPFQERTWGFTDTADINLSLPQYKWIFKDCLMRIKNLDDTEVDTFSPVDVAEVAQGIVKKCIVDTKERLGGNADVGQLEFPRRFYVVVSGTARVSKEYLGNGTLLSLPLGGSPIVESRISSISPKEDPLSMVSTEGLEAGTMYPVNCFDPFRKPRLKTAVASDCNFIMNEIILRLPNPMTVQTFGWTDAEDINLAEKGNSQWIYGQCMVFIKSFDGRVGRDRFRFVDVVVAGHRIIEHCIEEVKYAIGGISDVGTVKDKFYVGVAGMDPSDLNNGTLLELTSSTESSSPSRTMLRLPSKNSAVLIPSDDENSTESIDLTKRSSNVTQLVTANKVYIPPVKCINAGTPAARKIEIRDCTNVAILLLSDPQVLVPKSFTTEPIGGIEMPFLSHNESCYLMMDTSLDLSVSASITLLKMVYWASEIMLTCISGRAQGFGGVATLDSDREIFVSVTGVDPRDSTVRNELAKLSNEGTSALDLKDNPLQVVESGQS